MCWFEHSLRSRSLAFGWTGKHFNDL